MFEFFICIDDDMWCKFYKGKNDYINVNYVMVSVICEYVIIVNEEIKLL